MRLDLFWDTDSSSIQYRTNNVWTTVGTYTPGGPGTVVLSSVVPVSPVPDDGESYFSLVQNVTNTTTTNTTTTTTNLVLGDPQDEPFEFDRVISGVHVVSVDVRVNYPSWPTTLTENVVMPPSRSAVMHGPLTLDGYTIDFTSSTLATL